MTDRRDKNEQSSHNKPDSEGRPVVAYDVGYGKPPKASQFKKGEVANPKGRPRKAKIGPEDPKNLLRKALERKLKVTLNDTEREMSSLEILFQSLVRKPTAASVVAMKHLLDITALLYQDANGGDEDETHQYAEDAAILRARIEEIAMRREAARKAEEEAKALADSKRHPRPEPDL